MNFETTAINVLLLVAMAIPGFLIVKAKMIKPNGLKYFSIVLLYVCQPFLSLRSFLRVEYTSQLAINLAIVFAFSTVIQLFVFGVMILIFRSKFYKPSENLKYSRLNMLSASSASSETAMTPQDVARGKAYRIMTLCATFGNVGFFGVPVLQVLFPINPETIAYSAVYIVSMNLMCWTIGATVVTGNRKFASFKKVLLNPQTITLFIALPLFFAGVTSDIVPSEVNKIIDYLADMTAPLCMICLGMRFGFSSPKELFTDPKVYMITAIKIILMPLLAYLIVFALPLDSSLKATLVLLSGMPSAIICLNLSEIYNGNQKMSANTILMSTLFSIITIPLFMMLPL